MPHRAVSAASTASKNVVMAAKPWQAGISGSKWSLRRGLAAGGSASRRAIISSVTVNESECSAGPAWVPSAAASPGGMSG